MPLENDQQQAFNRVYDKIEAGNEYMRDRMIDIYSRLRAMWWMMIGTWAVLGILVKEAVSEYLAK